MIIIPSSRKMTFQSIPVSSEKKMSWAPTAPTPATTAAPPSATMARGNRSCTISPQAATNTTSGIHPLIANRSLSPRNGCCA